MEYFESVLIIIFIGTGILYAILIWSYTYGWYILKDKEHSEKYTDTSISIIIPARNEEENIDVSLFSALNQHYPPEKFQLILVDDHSNDRTVNIAEKFLEQYDNFHIIKLTDENKGKKAAISTGILYAKGELIVTTDADCQFPTSWLRKISDYYQAEKPKMILGPVVFEEGPSFFQKIQSLEFLSLIATGAGSVAINTPILCNGANLAYEKKAFEMVEGFRNNQDMASGDDIFLLFKIRKKFGNKSVKYLKSFDAIVKTPPPPKPARLFTAKNPLDIKVESLH